MTVFSLTLTERRQRNRKFVASTYDKASKTRPGWQQVCRNMVALFDQEDKRPVIRNHAAGKVLATAIREYTDGNIDVDSVIRSIDACCGIGTRPTGLAEWLDHQNEIGECANCSSLYAAEDGRISESHIAEVCPGCADEMVWVDDALYSPDDRRVVEAQSSRNSVEWVMRDDARETHNGWYTEGYAESQGYYYQDDNGIWVDEDPDYQDEESEYGGIRAYHSHPLRNGGYFDEAQPSTDPAIGVELECYMEGDLYDAMESNGLEWILERDASLDGVHGVEIVSPPLTLSQWRETMPELSSAFSAAGVSAYDAKGGTYGIHVSVHRRHLSPLQEARISLFLACEENADFIRAIAQRSGIYCPSLDIGGIYAKSPKKVGQLKGKGKFAPFNLKSDNLGNPGVFEVRVFQSTTKAESILKNIEFVAALVAWSMPKSATGSEYRYAPFCHWLSSHKKEYPNLVAYLAKDEYKIKGGRVIAKAWEV